MIRSGKRAGAPRTHGRKGANAGDGSPEQEARLAACTPRGSLRGCQRVFWEMFGPGMADLRSLQQVKVSASSCKGLGIPPGKGWAGRASTTPPRRQRIWGWGRQLATGLGASLGHPGHPGPHAAAAAAAAFPSCRHFVSLALILLLVWTRRRVALRLLQGWQSIWGYF